MEANATNQKICPVMYYNIQQIHPGLFLEAGGGTLYAILDELDELERTLAEKPSTSLHWSITMHIRQATIKTLVRIFQRIPKLRGNGRDIAKRLQLISRIEYAERIGADVDQIVYESDHQDGGTSIYLVTAIEGFVKPGGNRVPADSKKYGAAFLGRSTYHTYKIE